MQIDPRDHASRNIYQLLTSIVVPRPIAWVSTISRGGIANLAPFSFFNAITSKPPLLSIAVGRRRGERKDTAHNASSTRELVVNMVDECNLEAMVQSSGEYPAEVDEFEKVGVTAIPSVLVKPPRVKEATVQLECRTREIFEVSPGIVDLVIAEVVMVHLDDSVMVDDELHVAVDSLHPVARLGGSDYALLGERRSVPRPVV